MINMVFERKRNEKTGVGLMTIYLYRAANFNKSLETMTRGGKTASLAAKRAETILGKLSSGDWQNIEVLSRRTKHGELRISGCEKYDLGGGYRLVCVNQKGCVAAACVGSHDDCHRWIENNRGFELVPSHQSCSPFVAATQGSEDVPRPESEAHEPDYDDALMERIDDRTLRQVFCGLCGDSPQG